MDLSLELTFRGSVLAETLRALRTLRRLRQVDVAKGLRMSRRCYLDLEAGVGRMSLAQAIAFTDFTDSDRYAFVAAVLSGQPAFALHCANNKFATIMMMAATDFHAAAGARLAEVRPFELMQALKPLLAALMQSLDARAALDCDLLRLVSNPSEPESPER